jgi:hypothetical protein
MARIIFEDSAGDKFWIDDEGFLVTDLSESHEIEVVLLAPEDTRQFAIWLLTQIEGEVDFGDDDDEDLEDEERDDTYDEFIRALLDERAKLMAAYRESLKDDEFNCDDPDCDCHNPTVIADRRRIKDEGLTNDEILAAYRRLAKGTKDDELPIELKVHMHAEDY